MRVPMAVHIATNPVKGKSPHGCSLRQGEVRFSKASGNTWMNAVAKITPAAKAFIMKKISFSGLNAGITLPRRGIHNPIALAIRIDIKAIILYLIAFTLSWSSSSLSHVHSAVTRVGRTTNKINIKDQNKSWSFPLNLPMVEKCWTDRNRGKNRVKCEKQKHTRTPSSGISFYLSRVLIYEDRYFWGTRIILGEKWWRMI